jgi:hypothetical protein
VIWESFCLESEPISGNPSPEGYYVASNVLSSQKTRPILRIQHYNGVHIFIDTILALGTSKGALKSK